MISKLVNMKKYSVLCTTDATNSTTNNTTGNTNVITTTTTTTATIPSFNYIGSITFDPIKGI